MFGKHKKTPGATTLISKSTRIVGDLNFSGHLEIEGTIRGNIIATGAESFVRVSEGGRVEGQINVAAIVINGTVIGDVYSAKYLVLTEQAQVKGDVHYAVIEMARGAHINGKLVFVEKPDSKPRLKVETSPPAPPENSPAQTVTT